MSKLLPYFRWYAADAEADAKYAAMSLAELGLYHRCLNHSWINNGMNPDRVELPRELRVNGREFDKLWDRGRVSACFELRDDRLKNPRQERERLYAQTKSERASNSVRTRYERITDDLPRAYESESSHPVLNLKNKESDEWFESKFWPLWPTKENKESAKKASRKIPPEDRHECIKGLVYQKDRISCMERPIHAATWINSKRWNDEFVPPPELNGNHKNARQRALDEAWKECES